MLTDVEQEIYDKGIQDREPNLSYSNLFGEDEDY